MSDFSIPSWLPAALTGGLAGSALTLTINWMRTEFEKRSARASLLRALKQELRHTQWLIKYNHGRINDGNLIHKGLASISTSVMEQILFGSSTLHLTKEIFDHLHDCLEQIVYHNNLFSEYMALIPNLPIDNRGAISHRTTNCMNEIAAICTQDDTYRNDPTQLSLQARVKRLLEELESVKP
jgi:hypothetical protein